MRVAHVLHGWPPEEMGGTGLYVDALARALASLGHEVAIVHPSTSQAPTYSAQSKTERPQPPRPEASALARHMGRRRLDLDGLVSNVGA